MAVADICRVLEIDPKTVPDLGSLKLAAKAQRKALALKYHPDRGGNVAQMAEINRVCDHVEKAVRYFVLLPPRVEIYRQAAQQWAAAMGFGFSVDPRVYQHAAQQQAAYYQGQNTTTSGNPFF